MPEIWQHPALKAIGGWNIGYKPDWLEVTWYSDPGIKIRVTMRNEQGDNVGVSEETDESPIIIPLTWVNGDYLDYVRFDISDNNSDIYITNLRFQ